MSFSEHKALASLKVTVEARANLLQNDLKSVTRNSMSVTLVILTFANELASYGKSFVLVLGPFANLSCDFSQHLALDGFIARERSIYTIKFLDTRPDIILSM